nr:efflux RND transporter periplasmic adaptor subunit [Bacteroidota bacterium]
MIKNHLVLFCLAFMIIGCTSKNNAPTQKPAIPVGIYKVSEEFIDNVLTYSGTITAYKSVNFGFMVSGKLNKVFIEEGTYVKKDQPIAELVATDYQFALDAAEAQFDRATKEYNRLKKLYDKNSLTQSDYDKITALYKEAKADYEYKQEQINYTSLQAPDDGWISFDHVYPGEIVKQGFPIFQLIHTEKVFVKAMVPENEISIITLGKKVEVIIPSVHDTLLEAIIQRIAPEAERFSRAFEVKALIENAGFILKPGMIAHVGIPSGQVDKQISIPTRAINRSANGETFVYIVKDKVAGKQYVRTGHAIGKQVIITSGLNPGDTIVTEGGTKLYEGAEVKIIGKKN